MSDWDDLRRVLKKLTLEELSEMEAEHGSLAIAGPKEVQRMGWTLDRLKGEVAAWVHEEMLRREGKSIPKKSSKRPACGTRFRS